jgi:hypothetical protein
MSMVLHCAVLIMWTNSVDFRFEEFSGRQELPLSCSMWYWRVIARRAISLDDRPNVEIENYT